MEREAAEDFAALTDLFREFRDCHDLYSEVEKLDIHEDFQGRIDRLVALQVSLRFAERSVLIGATTEGARRSPMKVAYVLAFPKGKEPTEISTARAMTIGV
ncbi:MULTISPECIES: hypothetical protein [unclassified Variovorax]|uniref:hypothetical protein n=1 Tax=unclassified Variovorax TaxID=663243 RepID=UPI000838F9E6|nr:MULTISPECIES: hypothetical protein [unclassified Variovorax]PNG46107.1 hypothetical protein CHC06_08085 [Variovorax sp. B2]PNG46234.1 hypothetical protein CHC07_07982 [Variovorax sp. B4]VTV19228.1 hypothetical protein WDL1P3_00158 [Variovorax sp. WDL1]